jgi:hypothetical protein
MTAVRMAPLMPSTKACWGSGHVDGLAGIASCSVHRIPARGAVVGSPRAQQVYPDFVLGLFPLDLEPPVQVAADPGTGRRPGLDVITCG